MRLSIASQLPCLLLLLFFGNPTALNVFQRGAAYKTSNLRCTIRIDGDGGDCISTGEIDTLVRQRAQYRKERNYTAADNLKDLLNLKYKVEVIDFPFNADGSISISLFKDSI